MEKLKLYLYVALAIFLTSFICLPQVSASGEYSHTYYISSTDNPSAIYGMPFWSDEDTCTVSISNRLNIGTDTYPYTISSTYYIPEGNLLGSFPPLELSVNSSCFYTGSSSSSTANITEYNYFNSRSTSTISGSLISQKTILAVEVNCTTEDNWIEIFSNGTLRNGEGRVPTIYTNEGDNEWYFEDDEYNACYGIDKQYLSDGQINVVPYSVIMPFTTGETGQVQLEILENAGNNPQLSYYELEDFDTSYTIVTAGVPGTLTHYDFILKPNTEYAFIINKTSAGTMDTPKLNLSIMTYIPDWVCGDYSECTEGYKSRTCVDPEGIANNKIETLSCFGEIVEDIYLGFEEGTSYSPIRKCVPEPWAFCGFTRQNISTEYPTYWTINNPNDYNILTMSDTFSSERSRSLKMWWIPPYTARPQTYGSGADLCVNDTIGHYPYVTGYADNSTILNYTWVGLNLTFPNPYMKLVFDVKNCENPVEQYNVPGGLLGLGYCGQGCYAPSGNCSTQNQGRYFLSIINVDTGELVVQKFGNAPDNWQTIQIDLSNNVINTYNNYSIVLGINPLDITESVSRCAYFDNMRLQYTTSDFNCDESFCDGDDLYLPELYNATCIFEVIKHSPECFESKYQGKIENKESFCVGMVLHLWDEDMKEWKYINESDQCLEETETTETPGALDPITQALEDSGLGDFTVFLQLSFLAIIISLLIPILLIKVLDIQNNAGQIFIIVFLVLLVMFSIVGWFPIWVAIAIIIIAGFILAKTVLGGMSGG